MSDKKTNRKAIISAAKKMIADKKAVLAYSDGNVSKKKLNEQGVKLVMPL